MRNWTTLIIITCTVINIATTFWAYNRANSLESEVCPKCAEVNTDPNKQIGSYGTAYPEGSTYKLGNIVPDPSVILNVNNDGVFEIWLDKATKLKFNYSGQTKEVTPTELWQCFYN
jgi:hypothetical protein